MDILETAIRYAAAEAEITLPDSAPLAEQSHFSTKSRRYSTPSPSSAQPGGTAPMR
jgi:hypothetical protein